MKKWTYTEIFLFILAGIFLGASFSTMYIFNKTDIYTPAKIEEIKKESWLKGYRQQQLEKIPSPYLY